MNDVICEINASNTIKSSHYNFDDSLITHITKNQHLKLKQDKVMNILYNELINKFNLESKGSKN
jgi:hypothetical protein